MNEALKLAAADLPPEFHLRVAKIMMAAGITENDPTVLWAYVLAYFREELKEDHEKHLGEHSAQHKKFTEMLSTYQSALSDSMVATTRTAKVITEEGKLTRNVFISGMEKILEEQASAERMRKSDNELLQAHSDLLEHVTWRLAAGFVMISVVAGIIIDNGGHWLIAQIWK